jgi:hypothetical protein
MILSPRVPIAVLAADVGNDINVDPITEANNPPLAGAEHVTEIEGGYQVEQLQITVPDEVVLSKDDDSMHQGSWTKSDNIEKHETLGAPAFRIFDHIWSPVKFTLL